MTWTTKRDVRSVGSTGGRRAPVAGGRAGFRGVVPWTAIVVIGVVGCSSSPGKNPEPGGSPTSVASGYALELESAVDAARRGEGIVPLAHDDCAARAAAARAESLVGAEKLTHGDLDDVLGECDVARAGENLARSERPPKEVVHAWLDSPGHASNIRDKGFDRGAVACVQDGEVDEKPQMLCSHVFLESSEPDVSS